VELNGPCILEGKFSIVTGGAMGIGVIINDFLQVIHTLASLVEFVKMTKIKSWICMTCLQDSSSMQKS
jgi:hypothetical protein